MTLLEELRAEPLLRAGAETRTSKIHFIVDSGAAETVIPGGTLEHIPTTRGNQFGARYKGIEGSVVENIGEQMIHGSVGAKAARIEAQVFGVSKPL